VTTVQLGRSLNSDGSIGNIATRFKPDQTVFASVLTDNAGKGTVKARWSFRGRTISEEEKKVSYRDVAGTSFRLNYAGGLPQGEYTVELFLDDMSIAKREFVVAP
jgi:hypothetical protein